MVAFPAGAAPGTIIVKTSERRLYFVIGDGIALRYPIAVGRAARQWFGPVSITGKHLQPAWSPPEDLRRENPDVPDVIPGGAPNNPMGVAALTLSGGDYAIHGTAARLDRHVRLVWLHPHVQRGHRPSLHARKRRHAGRGRALSVAPTNLSRRRPLQKAVADHREE